MDPESSPVDQPTHPTPSPAPVARPKRRRRSAIVSLIVAGLVLFCLVGGWFAYKSLSAPLVTASDLNLADYTLNSISMVSPEEGWAVGNTSTNYTTFDGKGVTNRVQPIMLHYLQGRWTRQPLPDFAHSAFCKMWADADACTNIALNSISMVSAQEGWAIGYTVPPGNVADAGTLGILLHYMDGTWTPVDIQASYLIKLSMRSATDGWMIGRALGPDGSGPPGVWHYDGQSWTPLTALSGIASYAITSTANGEVWISGTDTTVSVGDGEDSNDPTVLLHYDGSTWSKVDPHIANGSMESFAFTAPDEGWAVGMLPNTDQHRPSEVDGLIAQYHNGVWQEQTRFKNPSGQPYFELTGVAMASASEGWAVGQEGVLLHDVNGSWTQARSPTKEDLSSVTFVSASEGWAIGNHGVILHYQHGVWSVSLQSLPPQPTHTPTPGSGANLSQYVLHDLSMISPDEGWAVGNTTTPENPGASTVQLDGGDLVILHYLHGRWTSQPLPDYKGRLGCGGTNGGCPPFALYSVSMASAQEGWAIGSSVLGPNADGITFPLLFHYTGGKWVEVDLQNEALGSIYMRSANDGWAVGGISAPNGNVSTEVFHYDGHTWTPVFNPGTLSVAAGVIFGAPDGTLWVTGTDASGPVGNGEDGNEHSALLHYDGTHWSKVDLHIANGRLYSLAFTSPNDGWAVGMLPNTDQHRPSEVDGLLLHDHNGVWEQQPLIQDPFGQNFFSLNSVAMPSPHEGWAVGNEGVMLHYVNGVWERATSPTSQNLWQVTFVSASEGWAIGAQGTMLHYQNGSWSLYRG